MHYHLLKTSVPNGKDHKINNQPKISTYIYNIILNDKGGKYPYVKNVETIHNVECRMC